MTTTKKPVRGLWLFPMIAAALLAVSAWSMLNQRDAHAQMIYNEEVTIYDLQAQVANLTQAQNDAGRAAVALEAGAPVEGLEAAEQRVETDSALISELVKTMYSWGGHDEYVEARKVLMSRFGLPSDSEVLQTLMPEAPVSVDADGQERGYIDAAGLNSSLGSLSVTPTAVRGGQYSYLVLASVFSRSSDGSATAARANVVEVVTDAGEKVISVKGWSAPTAARSAGSASS